MSPWRAVLLTRLARPRDYITAPFAGSTKRRVRHCISVSLAVCADQLRRLDPSARKPDHVAVRTVRWVIFSVLATSGALVVATFVYLSQFVDFADPRDTELLLPDSLRGALEYSVVHFGGAVYLTLLAVLVHGKSWLRSRPMSFALSPIVGLLAWWIIDQGRRGTEIPFAVVVALGVALAVPPPPTYGSRWEALSKTYITAFTVGLLPIAIATMVFAP